MVYYDMKSLFSLNLNCLFGLKLFCLIEINQFVCLIILPQIILGMMMLMMIDNYFEYSKLGKKNSEHFKTKQKKIQFHF